MDRIMDWAGGAFFTLLASLPFFYFTNESPDLTYEVFPPSSFVSEQTERTIYTVRAANQGDAEAEDVRMVVDFPNGVKVQDSKVSTSSGAMTYTFEDTSALSIREYAFPLLNPGESAKFSFLLSGSPSPQAVEVDVRGRGVVGQERGDEKESDAWGNVIASVLGTLVTVLATLRIISHLRKRDSKA